jgi:hypothetical protein
MGSGEALAPDEPFDLVRALKTDNCSVLRLLAQCGQLTAWPRESTIRS